MAAITPPTELERLAHERDGLVAWLAREFAQALSIEDAEDIVSEALPGLANDPSLPATGRRRRVYLRRALQRDAIDELRRRHGRALRDGPRQLLPLERAVALADPSAAPEQHLEEQQAAVERQAVVGRTMARLRPEDAEVLRLKYLEGRAPDEIAAELGITRTQYERRLARAGANGVDALSTAEGSSACKSARQMLAVDGHRSRDEIERLDVHLLDCLHCRAFALRARGLLEAATLPLVGVLERAAARLGSILGRGGEPALHDARDVALAGGSAVGAGTAVGVGLGTKMAVSCAGVAIAAVCAGPIAHELAPKPNPAQAEQQQSATKRTKPRATPTTAPATPTPTVTVSQPVSTPTAAPTARPKKRAQRPRSTAKERRQRAKAAAAKEFGPESATPDVSAAAKASAATATTTSSASPPPPPPPKPASTSKGPTSSSFSGEFRP
ncbi:RNA polymerase sigma factor (sigma-70 family) [Solirubrobacter pauli]|uniref:RNA polymerase sigma factor (Sigma-70 family) n=1 Tax=Solirubrobacter pauli TaxID=166793 RepID=A0A660L976_9ACTN|nr:sigma-70 family RNA polymerase sigma factor [Solirubrobacter pauli]RKQ90815.1 RNA polymerase sigma factor (sigma-70 family) [Solirubrobacter pauli]